ncbi:MAG: TonB-dependent receptor [Phycisphaerales bacterium]
MVTPYGLAPVLAGVVFVASPNALGAAQQAGSIRGVVYDKDFGVPLGGAEVLIVETGQKATASDEGNFVFNQVSPGKYTLVFTKDGYTRQVKTDVLVTSGTLTDVESSLPGEFTEMDEYVVQDVQLGGSEAALLKLRFESPALIDSIGADLMSKAGASDAAAALNLVAGATVQDGKYAVIRGLPDRYVSSQLNGVRLPTADVDKRAVQLDQFPAAAIESVRVSKTFTPDQQGDASGGAVDVVLKRIPEETTFQFKSQIGYNTQAGGRKDFLSHTGPGLDYWGNESFRSEPQPLGESWDTPVGVANSNSPIDYKWSLAGGGKVELDDGIKLGGFGSFFYDRDSSFFNNGVDNSYWVTSPGNGLTPETVQGTPEQGDFKTKLLNVTQGSQSVQWGALGTLGLETENHKLGVTYLFTQVGEDTATLAEDTNGKEYYFPGYNPNNPTGPGNAPSELRDAPYNRLETLNYTQRNTQSIIFNGEHTLRFPDVEREDSVVRAPKFDWTISRSTASLDQPDKTQFGSIWLPPSFNPGFPPFLPPFTTEATYFPYKPAANFTLGNVQHIFKEIDETSQQYAANLKIPFVQWSDLDGYVKLGFFDDTVERTYNQDTFSNFNDNSSYKSPWTYFWSAAFPSQDHPITAGPPFVDVDYNGHQDISAIYAMADLPVTSYLKFIGGARLESTDISIENIPEKDATWFPPGSLAPVKLNPGDADVDYSQKNVLPAIAAVITPVDQVTARLSYSQTVARQTFKELTPIIQQEFLGGPIFIGNPDLQMAFLDNYDFRLDYTPFPAGLFSGSVFYKTITGPIEYVQRVTAFTYTTPVNFPSGKLLGFELEARQDLGQIWEEVTGLSLGANATFISSSVVLPPDEVAGFEQPNIQAPIYSQPMTGTPNHLFNLYATYEAKEIGLSAGLFYTVIGDALLTGAGQSNGNFVPAIYSTQYGTLNFTVTQTIVDGVSVFFQAKNLTNPAIQTVYRSPYIGADVLNTSFTNGIDLALGVNVQLKF